MRKRKNNEEIVFGVSHKVTESLGEFYFAVYMSTKECWEKNQCCSDYIKDKKIQKDLLYNEFHELMEGVYLSYEEKDREKIILKLKEIGLEYNKEFEDFMEDGLEEELYYEEE